jgi:ribonuclease D
MAVLAALYKWRHETAAREDESLRLTPPPNAKICFSRKFLIVSLNRYVLPNYMLLNIAEAMPTEPISLVALCSPTPPLVRMNAHEMCRLIAEAKANVCFGYSFRAFYSVTTF